MKRKAIISAVAIAALVATSSFAFAATDSGSLAAVKSEDTTVTSTQEQQDKANLGLSKDDFESYADFYTYLTRMHHTNGYTYKVIALKDEAGRYGEVNHVTLKGYSGTEENIVIPKLLLGMPVRYISEGTFVNNQTAKTIKVPASVETIRSGALTGCNAKLIKSSYLKKQKDGAYRAMATVKYYRYGKLKKVSYRASRITKLTTVKTIKMRVGDKKKLNVGVYVSGKKKAGYIDPAILKFSPSDQVKVTSYGNIKALRKGTTSIDVTLKTSGHATGVYSIVKIKVI